MTSLPLNRWAAQLTTAIVRMLGKAVKFRHCPATVSAPRSTSVERGNQLELVAQRRWLAQDHWSTAPGRCRASEGREAQVRRPVLRRSTSLRSEGNGGAFMLFRFAVLRALRFRPDFRPSYSLSFCCASLRAAVVDAASIRGVVTDASGARVTGATVQLIIERTGGGFGCFGGGWKFSDPDRDMRGRFFLVVSATKFRQMETPGFYAGQLDNIERNIVLEPEWVHESIVVTATGTPTPQPQTGAATSVIGPQELELSTDLVSALRHDAGNSGGAGRAARSADFAVCARRRFGFEPGAGGWRECRRSGRAIRFRAAVDDGDGAERSLSRAELEPVWRGCGERRGERRRRRMARRVFRR